MRLNFCLTILHVSNFAAQLLTLDANSEDSNCETGIEVRRDTSYVAVVGKSLKIHCLVHFCHNSKPTVSWFKLEDTAVPVDVSSGSHIKTEWNNSSPLKGTSYLIFQNILISDSGVYQCRSDLIGSHAINVFVHDVEESTNVTEKNDTNVEESTKGTEKNDTSTGQTTQEALWPFVYRVVGIVVFVVIVITLHVKTNSVCKGIRNAGRSGGPYPSRQRSNRGLPPTHIYENDQ